MKKIVITITEKNEEDVSINLDMKDDKKATQNEKIAATNVYYIIEEKLKEMENIK